MVRSERESDRDAVVQADRADLVRAEHDVPGAGSHRAGKVSGGRTVGGDAEGGAEATGPTAEAAPVQSDAALVEDADVTGVAQCSRRDGEFAVRVGNVDLSDTFGHLNREVHPVGCAGFEMARNGGGDGA